jgi:hypothetical protein
MTFDVNLDFCNRIILYKDFSRVNCDLDYGNLQVIIHPIIEGIVLTRGI